MATEGGFAHGAARSGGATVPVWDPLVRIFHWGLVGAVAVAWFTADEVQSAHEIAGYAVAGLVAFRLVWGFAGGRHARFVRFLRGPRATLAYLGEMARGRERRHIGHNPAGAAMIVALLVSLSATAFTGWWIAEPARLVLQVERPAITEPDLAGDDDGEGRDDAVEELHEALANLTLLLVALHLGGVALASVRHRENLARAMVTGRKRAPGPDDAA